MLLRMPAARFCRLVLGIGGVARRRMRVMRRGFVPAFFVVFRGLAVMLGSVIVLIRGIFVIVGRGMLVADDFLLV